MHNWFVFKDFIDASNEAAEFIAQKILLSIELKNICHVVLPGGNTPAKCLSHLAKKNLPWEKIHWYPGDERCYPSGHAERNDVMLQNNLWSHISNPNIYRIPAELGADEAAKIYSKIISSIECFDIAFLGMGEDGHTASLFPDNEVLQDNRPVVPVYNSPKSPSERVSLSIDTLSQAACRIVLASGGEKADIITRIKNGDMLPINCIGDINWFVDELAISE